MSSYGHTADYLYLDQTLRSYWAVLQSLELDMSKFAPRPLDDFAKEREERLQYMRELNPDKAEDDLVSFVDHQVRFWADPGFQFSRQFDHRYMTLFVPVVLVSHALTEALANAILALGLTEIGAPEVFRLIERTDLKRKWLVGPKSFQPDYAFPQATGLHETLVTLCRERNGLTHQKIELTVDGERVLEGTPLTRRSYVEDLRWLRRFFSLPYDLAELALRTCTRRPPMLLFDRAPIDQAPEHALIPASAAT